MYILHCVHAVSVHSLQHVGPPAIVLTTESDNLQDHGFQYLSHSRRDSRQSESSILTSRSISATLISPEPPPSDTNQNLLVPKSPIIRPRPSHLTVNQDRLSPLPASQHLLPTPAKVSMPAMSHKRSIAKLEPPDPQPLPQIVLTSDSPEPAPTLVAHPPALDPLENHRTSPTHARKQSSLSSSSSTDALRSQNSSNTSLLIPFSPLPKSPSLSSSMFQLTATPVRASNRNSTTSMPPIGRKRYVFSDEFQHLVKQATLEGMQSFKVHVSLELSY